MVGNVTKSIWQGIISNTGTVEGQQTMRDKAIAALTSPGLAVVNGTDITRAAAVGIDISSDVPAINAQLPSDNASSTELKSLLNQFLSTYSRIRRLDYYVHVTRWGTSGSANYHAFQYSRRGIGNSLDDTPAMANLYDDIESEEDINLDKYKQIIEGLNTAIETNKDVLHSANVVYCHSSCHSNCHASRGRR